MGKQGLTSILALTNGTTIISTRSKIFQKVDVDVEDLSISALIRLIEKIKSLTRAVLFLDNKLACRSALTGEIRAFLPHYRKQGLRSATLRAEIGLRSMSNAKL